MRLVGMSQESVSWVTVHGSDHFGLIKYGEIHNYLSGC